MNDQPERATLLGRLLAEHIGGRLSTEELPLATSPVETEPFRRLKAAYYEAGAQVAHLTQDRF